jgi:serpin B
MDGGKPMKILLGNVLLGLSLLALVSCNIPDLRKPDIAYAQSDKARITTPAVPPADLAELVDGNNAFALDLYRLLQAEKGGENLFFSPYSLSAALAMTYAGARGETEQQMAAALHFALPQDRLHPAFNGLDLMLASRGEGASGKDDEGFRLNVVNAVWGQAGYEFLGAFLDTLAENYGAGLRLLDFRTDPEASRRTINDWVSDQTEGLIQDLIPQGVIDQLTRLVLTNAIYFNAAWAEPFEAKKTEDRPFYLLDGNPVTVPMMHNSASYGYAQGSGYQAIELPYDGHELSMVVLLPDTGTFGAFEGSLDGSRLDAILGDLRQQSITLTMPKFKFDSDFSLSGALAALGMPAAFSSDADFSGMDGKRDLFIQEVVHKAFVTVDEEGTEAAAATGVVIGLMAAPGAPTEVTVDRPFLFLIRDVETGAILFLGRVLDPA